MSAHQVDDLSMQVDGMAIDDIGSGSPFLSLPEYVDNRDCERLLSMLLPPRAYPSATAATSFGDVYPLYSTYANSSASPPPVPSFYEFLEEAGIDIEQYEELARRYSPDVQWEDISPSVREFQIQEMYLEQVGDLCNEMAGISMSEDLTGNTFFNPSTEFDMTLAQEQFDSPGPFVRTILSTNGTTTDGIQF